MNDFVCNLPFEDRKRVIESQSFFACIQRFCKNFPNAKVIIGIDSRVLFKNNYDVYYEVNGKDIQILRKSKDLFIGADTLSFKEKGDELCVAFDISGVIGVGRKVFPVTYWSKQFIPYVADPEESYLYEINNNKHYLQKHTFVSYYNDFDDEKPLNNELTTATGVSMNLVFKNTPEMKAILEKHNGFAFAVTNSHWTPIAYDDEHIVVRATGGGNTGSEKYNPAYLLNVLANTRRIFGDTFIGVLSSYGCPRAVNAKNSTEFAKVADGLIISYGKGGTGNTKRHAEAVFALMELGYSNEVIDYFNQFNTGKGLPMGEEIKKIHEETKKNGFFHDNTEKTGRRMGYDDKLSRGEKFVAAVGAVLAGSALYKLYSKRQESKLKSKLAMNKLI